MGVLIDELRAWIDRRLVVDGDEGGIVATLRQIELLERGERALGHGSAALAEGVPMEAALIDLRQALAFARGIVGIGVEETVLDRVFSKFCVGK
jgi:tRNA modification GTPase